MKPKLTTRLAFGLVGALGCLLAAICLELFFAILPMNRLLNDQRTPLLLFEFPLKQENREQRLVDANAKSGDVEIILTWNNRNDLDLHCIDPQNEHIYYGHTKSSLTSGELDVDRNSKPKELTSTPIEHIYWPRGHAPVGNYQVIVDYFARHEKTPSGGDPTAFQVEVVQFGHRQTYRGELSFGYVRQQHVPGKVICVFNPQQYMKIEPGLPPSFLTALITHTLWGGTIAALLTTALCLALDRFYRLNYKLRLLTRKRMLRFLKICTGWGLLAGAIGQLVYSLLPSDWISKEPYVFHIIGLSLLGVLLGSGCGGTIPNLPRLPALIAGTIAGALSGVSFVAMETAMSSLFEQISHPRNQSITKYFMSNLAGSTIPGRLCAATFIGFAIGLMITLIVEPEEEQEATDRYTTGNIQPMRIGPEQGAPAGTLRRQ